MGRSPWRGYLGDAGSDGADAGGALTRLGGVWEIDWREPCDLGADSIGGGGMYLCRLRFASLGLEGEGRRGKWRKFQYKTHIMFYSGSFERVSAAH